MHDKLFESALGIGAPWSVKSVEFDAAAKRLTVLIDFAPGTRFGVPGDAGLHPVHDTVAKDYRRLNFFQHECHLRVRTPRVKWPDGLVRLVEPEFAGRLSGFTLLFEALGARLPEFAHIPFVAAPGTTKKLSKRDLAKYQTNPQFKKLFEAAEASARTLGVGGIAAVIR